MSTSTQLRADAVDQLLRRSALVWRGYNNVAAPAVATGHASLDSLLPGRGWPLGALTELYSHGIGIGELRLVIPALRRIACDDGRPVVLVRPPHIPYPPALAHAGLPLTRLTWWARVAEAAARWGAVLTPGAARAGAVLLWSEARSDVAMRRLQLAAEEGRALAFIYRPPRMLRNPSPAAVRLALHPATNALRIEVVKVRGGHGGSVLCPLRCAA